MLRLTLLLILTKFTLSIDPEIHQKYLTLPVEEFIEYFNGRNFSWTITKYNRNFHVNGGGIDHPEKLPRECNAILEDLPKSFDAREKWKECETISEINDQGTCGSCWTFGTANTASDRTCIHKGIHVHLAEQDLQCAEDNVCQGGSPASAFKFWQTNGLVSNKCKPYNITKLRGSTCKTQCVDNNISYEADKHFAERVYGLCTDANSIKSELINNGPIEASFIVFQDFHAYHGGIYEHKYGAQNGSHSVRVIGYGEEAGEEYWLVANSWGGIWGEMGTFRIKAFQEELGFEDGMYTGLPKN